MTAITETAGFWRKFACACQGVTERDRRNSRRANWRLLAWTSTFVAASFGLRGGVIPEGGWAYLIIAASTALGVWALMGYVRFIREADELLRKIQLEALGVGFGAAMLGSFTLALVERASGWSFDAGDLLLVMVIGYMAGIVTGMRRYA
ncbi:MAG: hypothetical protein R2752_10550 [Vicinamibacterales bacterium]